MYYTINHTPIKIHFLPVAYIAANLVSRVIRSEEILVVSAEHNLMRAYRFGYVQFDWENWE